jgi:hypothetical protein
MAIRSSYWTDFRAAIRYLKIMSAHDADGVDDIRMTTPFDWMFGFDGVLM